MMTRRAFSLALGVIPFAKPAEARAISYFSPAERAAVIADPTSITALYDRHQARFKADLGAGFSRELEQHFKFGFAGLVALDLKPYGNSIVTSLTELVTAPALDCDNYAILHWRLFDLLEPQATTKVFAVGWNGGPIGNHAQMHCHLNADAQGKGGGSWMVDPTVGIMMCGHDYDWVASGKPLVSDVYLKSFHALCGRSDSATQTLHNRVSDALRFGLYRPSQLLYYYVDRDRFIDPVDDFRDWMTPQGSALVP